MVVFICLLIAALGGIYVVLYVVPIPIMVAFTSYGNLSVVLSSSCGDQMFRCLQQWRPCLFTDCGRW